MDEALVQNAEHDVNRNDGRQNQKRLVPDRVLKRLCCSLEAGVNTDGIPISRDAFSRADTAIAQRYIGSQS